jgi:hypothetical protein
MSDSSPRMLVLFFDGTSNDYDVLVCILPFSFVFRFSDRAILSEYECRKAACLAA